jgi:PAS domain S-box-containing protein
MATEVINKTILLVEDEGIIALAEAKTLQSNGYRVITAPNGEKAVDVFNNSPEIDLVLMDINLGSGMDGTQAAEIILAKRDLPLIFLSSHTEPEVVEKTEGITSYGYVVKGSGETVLLASIKMAFRLFEARVQERLKDEALQLSERQLKTITDTIPAYVAYVGLDDLRYRFVNTRFEESYKLPREQIIGSHIKDIIGQSNYEFAQKYLDIVRQGKSTSYENSFVTAGTERWVNVNYVPELNESGEPEAVVVLSFDITERKQAEEALQKAFDEKQVLLKEMQHRAKNSFAMITSLANLMADSNQSREARAALADFSERVRAIAELYKLLFVTDVSIETKLDEYFTRITASFLSSEKIHIKQTFEPITISVKTAASLGLILTELITNAIKHAYPGDRSGTITISLRKSDTGAIIEVIDNGVGFSDGFDLASSHTLGLTIVQSLAQQIQGNFQIKHGKVTRCVVEFPLG